MSLYHNKASEFFQLYESVTPQDVHRNWLSQLVNITSGKALDIGAGSGRDARFLAELGFAVTAVEPANALREQAITLWLKLPEPRPDICWLADKLPELKTLISQQHSFDLVLLSAVWMHLTSNERDKAIQVLSQLLASKALLIITLRHGGFNDGRSYYPVSSDEVLRLIDNYQLPLSPLLITDLETDTLGRCDVLWQTVVLKKE